MNAEAALPEAAEPAAGAGEQQADTAAPADQNEAPQADGEGGEAKAEAKPEKTPEQREIARLQRRLDRVVRQREEARAQSLQREPIGDTNRAEQGDSDSVSLSRAELQGLIEAEAKKLAPSIKEQQAAIEQREAVVQSLAKTWGQAKFDALASDLDDAFGGLADGRGQPKPATDAIFEADDPAALIEYLADSDNTAEAEAIARMSPVQAGRAIERLERKLAEAKAKDKPQPSRAAAPLEAVRGGGTARSSAPDPANTKAWIKWRNEQDRAGR